MKTITCIIGTAGLAALFCVGCQKSESTTDSSEVAPEEVVVEEGSIEETVAATADTAKQAISDTTAQAQDLLNQAQKLVSEKKYEEATSLLQKIAGMELSPEQQKLLDSLKSTIQKAMESGAVNEGTKAIGNMLGGEK